MRACVRARGSADSYALRVYSCTPEKASLFGLVYTSLLRLSFPLLSVLAVSRGCTEGAEAWKCPLLEGRRVNDEDSNRMERIVGEGGGEFMGRVISSNEFIRDGVFNSSVVES